MPPGATQAPHRWLANYTIITSPRPLLLWTTLHRDICRRPTRPLVKRTAAGGSSAHGEEHPGTFARGISGQTVKYNHRHHYEMKREGGRLRNLCQVLRIKDLWSGCARSLAYQLFLNL